MAETLHRTVGEVLHGSGGHRPLSSAELVEWMAFFRLKAYEREKAERRAKTQRA